MEENKNNTAAAAEATIDSIKKLMDAIGNDDELKQKLEETLAALTGKASGSTEEQAADQAKETQPEDEEQPADAEDEDAEDADAEDEDEDEEDEDTSSDNGLSDIFNENALAGMAVGFVAGAAVVGGGVLLHKLITNN